MAFAEAAWLQRIQLFQDLMFAEVSLLSPESLEQVQNVFKKDVGCY